MPGTEVGSLALSRQRGVAEEGERGEEVHATGPRLGALPGWKMGGWELPSCPTGPWPSQPAALAVPPAGPQLQQAAERALDEGQYLGSRLAPLGSSQGAEVAEDEHELIWASKGRTSSGWASDFGAEPAVQRGLPSVGGLSIDPQELQWGRKGPRKKLLWPLGANPTVLKWGAKGRRKDLPQPALGSAGMAVLQQPLEQPEQQPLGQPGAQQGQHEQSPGGNEAAAPILEKVPLPAQQAQPQQGSDSSTQRSVPILQQMLMRAQQHQGEAKQAERAGSTEERARRLIWEGGGGASTPPVPAHQAQQDQGQLQQTSDSMGASPPIVLAPLPAQQAQQAPAGGAEEGQQLETLGGEAGAAKRREHELESEPAGTRVLSAGEVITTHSVPGSAPSCAQRAFSVDSQEQQLRRSGMGGQDTVHPGPSRSQPGDELVGSRVLVYWEKQGAWYEGTVTHFHSGREASRAGVEGQHTVLYDVESKRVVHVLSKTRYQLLGQGQGNGEGKGDGKKREERDGREETEQPAPSSKGEMEEGTKAMAPSNKGTPQLSSSKGKARSNSAGGEAGSAGGKREGGGEARQGRAMKRNRLEVCEEPQCSNWTLCPSGGAWRLIPNHYLSRKRITLPDTVTEAVGISAKGVRLHQQLVLSREQGAVGVELQVLHDSASDPTRRGYTLKAKSPADFQLLGLRKQHVLWVGQASKFASGTATLPFTVTDPDAEEMDAASGNTIVLEEEAGCEVEESPEVEGGEGAKEAGPFLTAVTNKRVPELPVCAEPLASKWSRKPSGGAWRIIPYRFPADTRITLPLGVAQLLGIAEGRTQLHKDLQMANASQQPANPAATCHASQYGTKFVLQGWAGFRELGLQAGHVLWLGPVDTSPQGPTTLPFTVTAPQHIEGRHAGGDGGQGAAAAGNKRSREECRASGPQPEPRVTRARVGSRGAGAGGASRGEGRPQASPGQPGSSGLSSHTGAALPTGRIAATGFSVRIKADNLQQGTLELPGAEGDALGLGSAAQCGTAVLFVPQRDSRGWLVSIVAASDGHSRHYILQGEGFKTLLDRMGMRPGDLLQLQPLQLGGPGSFAELHFAVKKQSRKGRGSRHLSASELPTSEPPTPVAGGVGGSGALRGSSPMGSADAGMGPQYQHRSQQQAPPPPQQQPLPQPPQQPAQPSRDLGSSRPGPPAQLGETGTGAALDGSRPSGGASVPPAPAAAVPGGTPQQGGQQAEQVKEGMHDMWSLLEEVQLALEAAQVEPELLTQLDMAWLGMGAKQQVSTHAAVMQAAAGGQQGPGGQAAVRAAVLDAMDAAGGGRASGGGGDEGAAAVGGVGSPQDRSGGVGEVPAGGGEGEVGAAGVDGLEEEKYSQLLELQTLLESAWVDPACITELELSWEDMEPHQQHCTYRVLNQAAVAAAAGGPSTAWAAGVLQQLVERAVGSLQHGKDVEGRDMHAMLCGLLGLLEGVDGVEPCLLTKLSLAWLGRPMQLWHVSKERSIRGALGQGLGQLRRVLAAITGGQGQS